MASGYEFGDRYTPEQAYAPSPYRKGSYWRGIQGGWAASSAPAQQPVMATAEDSNAPVGQRAGQIMASMRAAGTDQAEPQQAGFKKSQDASAAFSGASTALTSAQADAAGMALKGTSQAMLDRQQGHQDLLDWMSTETRAIQAGNEQKADSRKKGGGIIGAIGTIAGSMIGGPIGAGVGALGSLFG